MDKAILLKIASIGFACLGGLWSVWTGRTSDRDSESSDSSRRAHYLVSYALTSISMLLFAAIAFV
jgi:hypothetical protein